MSNKIPLPFWSTPPCRRFCPPWWWGWVKFLAYEWVWDIYRFLHRGRYGWAPGDQIDAASYLSGVIGGVLGRMADCPFGAPHGYPNPLPSLDSETDFDAWGGDLKRWSEAFLSYARDDYYELHGHKPTFDDWHADEQERREKLRVALQEIVPWWEALWT